MSTIIGYSPEITYMLEQLQRRLRAVLDGHVPATLSTERGAIDPRFDIIIGNVGLKDLSKVKEDTKSLPGLDQWPNTASSAINPIRFDKFGNRVDGIPHPKEPNPDWVTPASRSRSEQDAEEYLQAVDKNRAALPPSSPATPSESPERVKTAELNPEWITADFEWPSVKPTQWSLFIQPFMEKWEQHTELTPEDMKAAFRAGYEAGRKAK